MILLNYVLLTATNTSIHRFYIQSLLFMPHFKTFHYLSPLFIFGIVDTTRKIVTCNAIYRGQFLARGHCLHQISRTPLRACCRSLTDRLKEGGPWGGRIQLELNGRRRTDRAFGSKKRAVSGFFRLCLEHRLFPHLPGGICRCPGCRKFLGTNKHRRTFFKQVCKAL